MGNPLNFISNQPYKALWLTALVLIVFCLIEFNRVIDIQMHDTYLVINKPLLYSPFIIFLFVLGSVYYLLRRRELILWMTLYHVITTSFTSLAIPMYIFSNSSEFVRPDTSTFSTFLILSATILVIAITGQILFILNIIFSTKR